MQSLGKVFAYRYGCHHRDYVLLGSIHVFWVNKYAENKVLTALTLPVIGTLTASGSLKIGPYDGYVITIFVLAQEIIGGVDFLFIDDLAIHYCMQSY